jgi:hypothetical protein
MFSGMMSFLKEHPNIPAFILGHEQARRLLGNDITLLNWDDFISKQLESL